MRHIKVILGCLLLALAAGSVIAKSESGPDYLLYTRRNAHSPQRVDPDVESLLRSPFYALDPIVVSIPSWRSNTSEVLLSALLEREACNVFALDLTESGSESEIVDSVSSFIVLLRRQFDVPLRQLQLVGYGEGAHLIGAAADQVRQQQGEQLLRLTALDPAGPHDALEHRLSAEAAEFVEVIHTNGNGLGTMEQLGHVDFYPNGGQQQPGCENKPDVDACAHERALELAAEMWSLANHFICAKCSSVQDMSARNCRWSSLLMGDVPAAGAATGIYFLETRNSSPFGRGAYHIDFL